MDRRKRDTHTTRGRTGGRPGTVRGSGVRSTGLLAAAANVPLPELRSVVIGAFLAVAMRGWDNRAMAIEGGLVVGYLTAALLGAGKRWADRRLDSLLDSLTGLVQEKLGTRPVDNLRDTPTDPQAQRDLELVIDGAIARDQAFRAEVSRLVRELDQRNGRQLLNQVYANTNMQAFDNGMVVGRDFNYFSAPDPSDLSGAPGWVKAFLVIGALFAMGGLAIFFITLFTQIPDLGDPDFGQTPPGIPLAFGVFFVGFVLMGIASIGRSLSKRR